MSIVPRQLVWYEVNSYVHSQILKTLLEMMRVDNFDSITISRLTAKAEVGRASFYRNYQTKEDVLRQEAERLNNELNNIRRNDDPNDYRLKLLRTLDFYMTIYNAGLTLYPNYLIKSRSMLPYYVSEPWQWTLHPLHDTHG